MPQWSAILAPALLTCFFTANWAQESVTIKVKKKSTDLSVMVEYVDVQINKLIAKDANGKIVQEKAGQVKTEMCFVETVRKQPQNDLLLDSLKRDYQKACVTIDGIQTKLPVGGKVVLIDKINDGYSFRLADGGQLSEADLKSLQEEFSFRTIVDEIAELLLPRHQIKEKEAWKVPMHSVGKALAKEGIIADADKCTGTGILLRKFDKGGHQFAEINWVLKIPLIAIKSDEGEMRLNAGAVMQFESFGEICIDGSLTDHKIKTTTRYTAEAVIDLDGVRLVIAIESGGTIEKTVEERPLAKDR